MPKETLLDGIDAYNKKLAEADAYYEQNLHSNLKKIKSTSKVVQDFISRRLDGDITTHIVDDLLLTKNNTKELKKVGKKVIQFIKKTEKVLEPVEAKEVFKKLDESINKTNGFIKRTGIERRM